MADFIVEEVPAPRSLEGEEGAVFEELIAIRNATDVVGYGTEDVTSTPAEMLPHYVEDKNTLRVVVARDGRRIVGAAVHQVTETTPQTAWTDLRVLPEFQGRGIGRVLGERLEAIGRESGQATLTTYIVHGDGPGPRLTPPTGAGSIPADNREVRFLLARGWTFEQVERGSRFELPGDSALLQQKRDDAQAHAADYRVVSWLGETPDEYLDDSALLYTRMSTDAPSAGLDSPEDPWDAERIRAHEAGVLASPQQLVTSAVQHIPTGRLAGYTRLVVPHGVDRPVGQWATIVLSEHRGHRLGMLLKVANLQFLNAELPGHPSVLTWNAEENRFMLSTNEAVGFVPIGYEGAWQKRL